jgi:hypothetical protein
MGGFFLDPRFDLRPGNYVRSNCLTFLFRGRRCPAYRWPYSHRTSANGIQKLRDHRDVSLEDALTDFRQHLLTFLATPQDLGLERLVFGITSRNRELGERLFVAGPSRVLEILKSMLRDGQASGELLISNMDEATDDLVGLWQGLLPVDLSFHQPPDPRAAYLRAR